MIFRPASMTLLLPESLIERLKATEQNPRYHGEGNVYNHTLLVLEQYHTHIDTYNLSEADQEVLYWAAMLHDVGKAEVTRWEGGRWRSPGHEQAGVPIARDILLEKAISAAQRKRILDLVRWHYVPFRWGREQRSLDAYKLLATQTDLHLLGIFALFDMMGRECEDKATVVGYVQRFNDYIVPQVTKTLGTYDEVQRYFWEAGYSKKNALWVTWKRKEALLMEKILMLKVPADRAKGARCVITIGAPRSGKTQYVKEHYPGHTYLSVSDFFSNSFQDSLDSTSIRSLSAHLTPLLRKGVPIVLDGMNLHKKHRDQLSKIILGASGTLHFVFFEKSLSSLLSQNQLYPQALDEQVIIQAHKHLAYPHPWESHSFEVVEEENE